MVYLNNISYRELLETKDYYIATPIGTSMMPTEERESIGSVKPSGWHTVKYDIVDGKYLYNRCHLIGFQLTGENANEENLIRLNKQNMIMIVASVAALCVMAVAKYGLKKQTLLGIAIVLILGGGGTSLFNIIIKDNTKKAIAILVDGGISAVIYSALMGGSSSAFVVQYVILALGAMYFNLKITTYSTVPIAVVNFIMAFVYPPTVEGPGGTVVGALSKVIMFIITFIMIRLAIKAGEKVNKESFENAYETNYKIFFVNISFTGLPINNVTGFSPFLSGVFEGDVPDYEEFDGVVHKILSSCPDALIFPRINVAMPRKWIEENPSECVGTPTGIREALCSEKYLRDGAELLKKMLSYFRSADYKDSIAGYQLCGGTTQEWMHHDMAGSFSEKRFEKFCFS